MRSSFGGGRNWLLCMVIGAVAVLGGCDASMRSDMLTGVETAATGLATTVIQAFFDGLMNQQSEQTPAV